MRVAHFSDVHVLSLKGTRPRQFLNKRWTGALNLALNRAKHYRVTVFEQLLTAVQALGVDHTVCTGDLVNLALQPEFEQVAVLLRDAFAPDALTVVPGNHDYYTKDAVTAGLFERHFADWLPHDLDLGGGAYPVTALRGGLAVIGLSSAIPTPIFLAAGRIGGPRLEALGRALRHPEVAGRFRLLSLHHPLLPDPQGRRLEGARALRDAHALIETVWGVGPAAPHLVVHGHNHGFARQAVPGTEVPILQVASGSRFAAGKPAEFNVYVIEGQTLVGVERHVHDPDTGLFHRRDEAGAPLAAA